jgi:predicted TIM-barrel fold metal-dependent hydrolase
VEHVDTSEPLVLVSCDSHVGPTLEQMRPYCPSDRLDDYDAFTQDMGPKFDIWHDMREVLKQLDDPREAAIRERELDRNLQTAGHHDMDARRRDMDVDGVAADVIYHSSQNGQPMPLIPGGSLWFDPTTGDLERAAVGTHIYNEWLADACATAPERHVGVVHLPIWDIEASIREVIWARERGLRAANLSTPRPGLKIYDHPDWEPFWATCADLGVTLNSHVGGAGGDIEFIGPHATALSLVDRAGWLSRRSLPRMIFSGVFERYPTLKYVLTEQNGDWWAATMREYDSAYETYGWQFKDRVPKRPSEYCATNVFIGASYMAPFEAEMAVEQGYVDHVMWGSDYPHAEGTFQYPDDPAYPNTTHLALRYTFNAVEPADVRRMVGETAIRCYGLDADALRPIAQRINSPTLDELAVPVSASEIPELTASLGFRTTGAWG